MLRTLKETGLVIVAVLLLMFMAMYGFVVMVAPYILWFGAVWVVFHFAAKLW